MKRKHVLTSRRALAAMPGADWPRERVRNAGKKVEPNKAQINRFGRRHPEKVWMPL